MIRHVAEFDRIGVDVPAHDEELLLPACLAALRVATQAVEIPVHVLVVLDACADDTAAAAGRTAVLPVWHRNVGAARGAGFAHLLEKLGADRTWLASTDADTCVPKTWLADQLAHARAGIEVVAGMVDVLDWEEHPPSTADRFRLMHRRIVGHRHVHGANLGMSADAYLDAGGFAPMTAHEDVALIAALHAAERRVLHTADTPVITSARRAGRAPAGFALFLTHLAELDPEYREGSRVAR